MSLAVSATTSGAGQGPHILMTLDAVGGVWRYAMDLAIAMTREGYRFTFAGLGPQPSAAQRAEAEQIGQLLWLDAPLDWITEDETALDRIPDLLRQIVDEHEIDLVHLNLPSQAAGLSLDIPVVAVSHSCVVTWFAAVRHSTVPADWDWQRRRNRDGFDHADAVVAPSHAHAAMLADSYGKIANLHVVWNCSTARPESLAKEELVFAAGRWWDEGKNGALLDEAAPHSVWPVFMAGPVHGPSGQWQELKHVNALGELPHSEVKQWMARAAIVASPSRYEPFGLAALEAAQAGAALVLADIPTYRELWDGAALFAPADDPQAFAAALNQLAANDVLRHDYAARAQERAGRYTLAAQAAAMQSIYADLLQPAHMQEA